MSSNADKILAVPTNIITGFLGVGKTTVILNLLKRKPSNERWAVLVNEFGEVGVDGSIIEGQYGEEQGVFIREVPGGCMCCASGLPMQIALNQLLNRAKPDRLLIEPTGLGHPREVLEVLSADHYQDILDIQQCLTLVDARNVSDSRYIEHPIFNQQIDIADRIIGHKSDLYDSSIKKDLVHYVVERRGKTLPIFFAQQGEVDVSLLEGPSAVVAGLKHNHHLHESNTAPDINEQSFPECGFLKAENTDGTYNSVGWRFSPDKVFNRKNLFCWLSGLNVERVKGVFITNEGVFSYNISYEAVTEIELDDCIESRIEIICNDEFGVDENALLKCLEVENFEKLSKGF